MIPYSPSPRQPYVRTLARGGSEAGLNGWTPVDVDCPTVCYPYRDDAITGPATGVGAVRLGNLRVAYTPQQPFDDSGGYPEDANLMAFPSGHGGACYLSSPGRWWIFNKAVTPATDGSIPYIFFPCPDPLLAQAIYERKNSHSTPRNFEVAVAIGVTPLFFVQDLLDGVKAVDIHFSAFANTVRGYWGQAGALGMTFLANQVYRYEGKTLPLADFEINSTSAGTARVVLYR